MRRLAGHSSLLGLSGQLTIIIGLSIGLYSIQKKSYTVSMIWFFAVLMIVAVVADRLTKTLAMSGRTWELGPLHFVLQQNDALVFSWPAPNWVALVTMFVALIVLVWLTRRAIRGHDRVAILGCACMMLGAISNGYDRIAYGYVVDWAYFGRWLPVFNLADVLVAIGVILVLTRWHILTSTTIKR